MSLSNMLEILQEKTKGKIVLIKLGVFYVATGADAVYLNKQFKLKCICFKKGECKIGIPESRLSFYVTKLESMDMGYIVYNFNNKEQKLYVEYETNGKYHNEKQKNKNCLICKGIRMYEDDKYLNAVQKLFEEEEENDRKETRDK